MRSFFAISLALVAGCGDNLSGPQDPQDDNEAPEQGATTGESTARLMPEVCGSRSWDVVYDAKQTDLRAVPNGAGAAIFMVSKAGGMLRGFQVDGRGLVVGSPGGYKIRADDDFTGLAATRVDDRYIVNLIGSTHVSVNVISDDLLQYRELGTLDGSVIGDTAMMHVRNVRVATTGGVSGMQMASFDASWATMGSEVVARSVATSMSSAAYGTEDAMIAWSTPSECHVARIGAGDDSMQPHACTNARLAVDYDHRGGWMLYEGDEGGVMIARIDTNAHNLIADEHPIDRYGTSPRVTYDGERFWASYIDIHGDLIVGILDEHGGLHSTAVDATRPSHDAYDLNAVNGAAWVYAADLAGIGATRICTKSI